MNGAEPNALGTWRRALRGREPGELLQLREELDEILAKPAMTEIRSLLIAAHDELEQGVIHGPALRGRDYAKTTGIIAGLGGFEELQRTVHELAELAEKKLNEQVGAERPPLRRIA